MSKKEREICEFEMDLKNLFVCALIDCEQSLVFFAKLLGTRNLSTRAAKPGAARNENNVVVSNRTR